MNNLLQLAQGLAVELSAADFPHLWKICPHRVGAWREEIATDDAWLHLSLAQGRLIIASDHPREMKNAGHADHITADANRKPEAIARDIANRLLPNAREHFARCRQHTRQRKEAQEAHTEILHILEPFQDWKRTDSDGERTEWHGGRCGRGRLPERLRRHRTLHRERRYHRGVLTECRKTAPEAVIRRCAAFVNAHMQSAGSRRLEAGSLADGA